jgi:3D (Asp-Asp-Asp) domain-containing protein
MKKLMMSILVLTLLLPIRVDARAQSDEKLISMGEFLLTYYCSCEECSGHWGTQTATGNHCEQGRTVAVDPDVIAYGTRILIDDNVYVAEDCGSAIKGDRIDIYVEDHELVEKLGKKVKKIWLIK